MGVTPIYRLNICYFLWVTAPNRFLAAKPKIPMVKLSSKAITLLLIAVVTFSCDPQQDLSPRRKSLDELTDMVLSSKKFNEIEVNINELQTSHSHFTSPTEEALVVPFKGRDGEKFVMAIFDEKQRIRKVFSFEAVTTITPQQVLDKMLNEQFDGTLKFGDRSGSFQVDLQESKIVSKVTIKNQLAREAEPECGDWTADDGPLGCAGARIEQMNWLEKTACYVVFMECLAMEVASCIIDDCVVNPVPAS